MPVGICSAAFRSPGVAPALPFLVDVVSAYPYAGYSIRKLRSDYAGPCLQMYRVNDGAFQDFGFGADNFVDVVAIATWLGASDGHIEILYDQIGTKHIRFTGTGFASTYRVLFTFDDGFGQPGFQGNGTSFLGDADGVASEWAFLHDTNPMTYSLVLSLPDIAQPNPQGYVLGNRRTGNAPGMVAAAGVQSFNTANHNYFTTITTYNASKNRPESFKTADVFTPKNYGRKRVISWYAGGPRGDLHIEVEPDGLAETNTNTVTFPANDNPSPQTVALNSLANSVDNSNFWGASQEFVFWTSQLSTVDIAAVHANQDDWFF